MLNSLPKGFLTKLGVFNQNDKKNWEIGKMDKENEFLESSKYFYQKLFIKREPRVQKCSKT